MLRQQLLPILGGGFSWGGGGDAVHSPARLSWCISRQGRLWWLKKALRQITAEAPSMGEGSVSPSAVDTFVGVPG